MKFLTDLHLLRELQEQTREFLRIQEGEEDFPEQDFYDVRPAIKRIRIEGTYLDETELFDLKRSLCTIINIVRFLNKDTEEDNGTEENRPGDDASVPYPALRRLTQGVSVYPQLCAALRAYSTNTAKSKTRHPPNYYVSAANLSLPKAESRAHCTPSCGTRNKTA